MRYVIATIACILSLSAAPVWAATQYWASPGASASTTCTLIDSTVGGADPGQYRNLAGAIGCAAAGDTVHMKAGNYAERIYEFTLSVPNGLSINSPTIIEGEGAAGCAIAANCNTTLTLGNNNLEDPQYITLRNFEIDSTGQNLGDNCLRFSTSSAYDTYVVMENMEIHHCGGNGVFTSANANRGRMTGVNLHHLARGGTNTHGCYIEGHDWILEYSIIHDQEGTNNNLGCQFYDSGDAGSVDRAVIRYNKFYNILNADALTVAGADAQVYRNEFTSSLRGFSTYAGAASPGGCNSGIVFNNNVVYGNTLGLYIGLFGSCTGTINLSNNIVVGNTTAVIFDNTGHAAWTSSGSKNAGNCGASCGSSAVSLSAITDVTVSTSNFTLKAGANAAVDAGAVIGGFAYNGSGPDIGVYETFTFATCSVEDGDASTLRVTFNNNAYPPLLPASAITGFTARKAGANDVITAAVRTGTNRGDLTLTNAIVGGNAVDISLVPGSSNLTDSALNGNTTNQPIVQTLTNQACTNNVGAPSTHQFTQTRFAWHGLYGTEAAPVSTPYATAPENTNIFVAVGGKGSARLRIKVTNSVANPPPTGFFPRYSRNAGGYTVVPDTFGADKIAFCGTSPDPDIPNSGTTTTEQLTAGGTFAAGALVTTSNAIPTVDMVLNGTTELEYCFSWATDSTPGDTFDFRLYQQDGTVLNTYTVTPRATLRAISAGSGF